MSRDHDKGPDQTETSGHDASASGWTPSANGRAGAGPMLRARLPKTTHDISVQRKPAGSATSTSARVPDSAPRGETGAAEQTERPFAGDDPFGVHLVDERVGRTTSPTGQWHDMAQSLAASLGVKPTIHADDVARVETESRGARGLAKPGSVFLDPALQPSSAEGRSVLAHEMVHVAQGELPAQQDGGRAVAESEAAQLAAIAATGQTPPRPGFAISLADGAADTDAKSHTAAGDDDDLPPGVLFEVVPGTTSIRVRTAWLDSGDPVGRNLELLMHLKERGVLAWAQPDQLRAAAAATRMTRATKDAAITRVQFSAALYNFIGLPPGIRSMISGWGDALTVTIETRDVEVAPGTVVPLTAEQLTSLVNTVEEFTQLQVLPAARQRLQQVQVSGYGGRGLFTFRLERDALDALFGHDAFQGWLDRHRGQDGDSGARNAQVGGSIGDLTPLELDRIKAWLAANLPTAAGVGGHLSRDLLTLIATIENHRFRSQILAALRQGIGRQGVNAISMQEIVNRAIFEAEAAEMDVKPAENAREYDPVHRVELPADLDQSAGRVVSGETVPMTLRIAWPSVLVGKEVDAYRFRPQVVNVDWVVQKTSGDLSDTGDSELVLASLGAVRAGRVTTRQVYEGSPRPQPFRFLLAPGEREAVWTVHAFAKHSHFLPKHLQTQVMVKSESQLMTELRAEATNGLGHAEGERHDFDTGVLNNNLGDDRYDDGLRFSGRLPADFVERSSAERDALRTREVESLRAMIAHLRSQDGGDNDAAIASAERYLARLEHADRAIEKDEADGWRSFEVRGTFLSRVPGVPDGTLDLYGTVQRTEMIRGPRGLAAVPNPQPVHVQLRDLSRRFDVDDMKFDGTGTTFEAALEQAFVKLCKAYPDGRVMILAQDQGDGRRAQRSTVGFELDTGTVGKDIKATLWDPAVNAVVNLAGMALMIFVPGSASIVMPALIAYNAGETLDHLHDEWERGTLTATDVTLGLTSIGLDLLPYLGRARALAGSRKAMLILEGVDLGGEAVYMTAAGLDQARHLQENMVMGMAGLYQEMVELERSTHASDPALLAKQAEFNRRAEEVRNATVEAFGKMIQQRVVFLGAKQAFKGARHIADRLGELHTRGVVVDRPGVAPHYDAERGQIVGNLRQLDEPTLQRLLDEQAVHMRDLARQAADDLGVPPESVEVVLDTDVSVSMEPGRVRLGYAPSVKPETARARWKAQAAANPGHLASRAAHGGDGSGKPPRTGADGGGGARGGGGHGAIAARVDEVGRPVSVLVSGLRHEGGGNFVLAIDGRAVPIRVTTSAGDSSEPNIAHDGGQVRIELPRSLSPEQVERTLAHALTKAAHVERRTAMGRPNDAPDALGPQGDGTFLTPADLGLVAELRVLRRQRLHAAAQGEAALPRLHEIDVEIRALERQMGLGDDERGRQRRRMVDVQIEVEGDRLRRDMARAALDGDKGHPGIEVHTHFMGIVDTEVFRHKAASVDGKKDAGSWLPLLERIAGMTKFEHGRAGDTITKRSAAGDAMDIVRAARDQIRLLRDRASEEGIADDDRASYRRAMEIMAEDACRHALATSPETDFNSSYEIRDQLVKDTFAETRKPGETNEQFEDRGYDQYTREALLALAKDGVGYTEPSNSAKKVRDRFGEDRVGRILDELIADGHLKPGEVDVRFLTMITTNHFGWRPDDAPPTAVGEPREPWETTRDELFEQLRQRQDLAGIDIAGQELFPFDATLGAARFRELYAGLRDVARARGRRLVLRPHVGEGAIDTLEGQPYHRDRDRARTPTGELTHYERSRHNIEVLLGALEDLQKRGLLDGTKVEVRFGHFTHAKPDQVARLKALGVTAEVNLASNVVTGSLDQTVGGVDGKPSKVEQFDDHSLPTLLYYDARTILSTDAHDVMSTTMREEFQRAHRVQI